MSRLMEKVALSVGVKKRAYKARLDRDTVAETGRLDKRMKGDSKGEAYRKWRKALDREHARKSVVRSKLNDRVVKQVATRNKAKKVRAVKGLSIGAGVIAAGYGAKKLYDRAKQS